MKKAARLAKVARFSFKNRKKAPQLLSELPQRLVRQASSIANKAMRKLILGEEKW